jgi:sugar lactone lactonase YvrE
VVALKGEVHGGQQPISGASLYLFAVTASTSGSGQLSTSLLLNTTDTQAGTYGYYVTTNATGGFTIGVGDYACTSGQQVYLYSVGGTSGFGTNSAAGLMAILGQCGSGNSFSNLPPSIEMNEVTTVATAYALAGFATDAAHVSGLNTATAKNGMANAALAAGNLAYLGSGQALTTTPAGNGTVPQREIDTLADILGSCINSGGPTSGSCSTLFSNATNNGANNGTQPTDTATAAINIAHNPGVNIGNLFALSPPTAPFQPSLINAPNDWTIAVTYTGGGLSRPDGIAIDASGNVWAANSTGNSLSEFSPIGVPANLSPFSGGGLSNPEGIAIDASGNLWIANAGSGTGASISEFSSTGSPTSGSSGDTGGGLNCPDSVAIDPSGFEWVANCADPGRISKFDSTGTAVSSSSGYTGGGLSGPQSIAVDASGNVWTSNETNNSISEFNSSGSASSPSTGYTGGGLGLPSGIAIDPAGNIWVANGQNNSLGEFNSGGTAVSGSGGYTGGGLNSPGFVAIDGSGNVWASNTGNSTISEFNSSGTPVSGSGGYESSGLNVPLGIAVDGSGDVWLTNFASGANSITEFVGAAAPVAATPLVNQPFTLSITTTTLPSGQVGTPYTANLVAVGGSKPYTWSQTGGAALSTYGLSLNAATGAISGTPTATGSAAPITFKVTDSGTPTPQTQTVNLTLTIQPAPLSISTTSLPSGQEGTAYSTTLAATGGTTPYTWSQTGGTALSTYGLSLNAATGVISGTPEETASATPLTFQVTDSNTPTPQQQSVNLTLTITAGTGMTVSVSPRNSGITVNQTLSLTPTTNDTNGVDWSASGTGCSGTGCGTLSATNTANGVAVVYTPPATPGAYTITAASASETTVSAAVNVGVTNLTGVYTYHNDNSRDGANTLEYALTTSNVATGKFGKLFSCTVDSPIYTQPLWVRNLTVNSAQHNVVFVATTNDSLYAFDADSNASPCTATSALWHANLLDTAHGGTTGEAPVPAGVSGALVGQTPPAGDIEPTVGVIGTPVIDSSTNTLYVVSKSFVKVGSTNMFYQRLHAIDITTGNEKFSGPESITSAITYPCSTNGCTTPVFNPQRQNQRCALALGNDGVTNVVYVAWSSHEDATPYFGWVVGFNAGTLAPEYVFNDVPDGLQGGIWMSGAAPAIDSSGNLYLLTGNGTFDATNGSAPNDDYGDSLLQLSSHLAVNQYFAPTYAPDDEPNSDDNDFGSGGAVVLINVPGGGGSLPTSLVIGGGKGGMASGSPPNLVGLPGYFYVLNGSTLGGYGDSQAYQEVYAGDQIYSTGAFWNNADGITTEGTYYLGPQNQALQAFTIRPTDLMLEAATNTGSVPKDAFGGYAFPGTTPSISASGATNGILWAQDNSKYCTKGSPGCNAAVLYAYDATDLATHLWNSSTGTGLGGISNAAGHAMKFTVPTVANGKVYVSTRGTGGATDKTVGELDVYGLLP